jgi:histidine triad (HIT) family protein
MCIYCRISAGELPASIVYEDYKTLAFLDIQPVTPGHVLIIPRHHSANLVDLPSEDACHMMRVGQMLDMALRRSDLRCEAVAMFLADGRAAGQDVNHVHLHVFPRYLGDGFEFSFDLMSRKQPGYEQLNADAEKIRQALDVVSSPAVMELV